MEFDCLHHAHLPYPQDYGRKRAARCLLRNSIHTKIWHHKACCGHKFVSASSTCIPLRSPFQSYPEIRHQVSSVRPESTVCGTRRSARFAVQAIFDHICCTAFSSVDSPAWRLHLHPKGRYHKAGQCIRPHQLSAVSLLLPIQYMSRPAP